MKLFGFEIKRAIQAKDFTLDEWIRKMEAFMLSASGVSVDCETALQSPTVHAIVRAVSSRISTLPVHVYRKTVRENRAMKEELPNHPVARLLNNPSLTQDRVNYWLDATSWLVRYNNYFAFKARGSTGPIRRLEPIPPYAITVEQENNTNSIKYRVSKIDGTQVVYDRSEIHHARGVSRDGVFGSSPVLEIREAIALEIAIEKFGASFFGNSAMPSLVFEYAEGVKGFTTDLQRQEFLKTFEAAYGGTKRFRAALMPQGIKMADPIALDNQKGQFLEARQYQRTVIAGAWGVPPHLVGDLMRATFSNVEQQSLDFVQNVVLPYVRIFEAAMEKDLLTQEDRNSGIIIRFNVDASLRGDFKSRQEGLALQRDRGIINPNEWREHEGMNPRTDEGGEQYFDRGPSGQGMEPAKEERTKNEEQEQEKEEALARLNGHSRP